LEARRALGRRYTRQLDELAGIRIPVEPDHMEANYQSYMVRVTQESGCDRDHLMQQLRERGIASRPGITAIHQQPIYRDFVRAPLPETDKAAATCLIIPLYPQMTEAEQDEVVAHLARLVEGS
jgi:perosamine synthetase